MTERNVFQQPEERVLLRTADVYQTEVADEVTSYSEKLLAIVADFKNSGAPEGFNAQSMVGKSKRGEVACRLFARVDPQTGIIEAAGFKARGCLAMTACASAVCLFVEGKGIEDALALTIDDVSEMVDGVPSDKIHALYFAVCAIRALVGDFLLRDGATLEQLDEAVPCDPLSIPCIMAEHCSLRQSRLECRMEEEAEANELAQNNACAAALDRVRENTARGLLTTPADWADLVPAHLMPGEFEALVLDCLEADASEEAVDLLAADGDAVQPDAPMPAAKPSEFANRGVGIPMMFGAKGKAGNAEADNGAPAPAEGASIAPGAAEAATGEAPVQAAPAMPPTKRALDGSLDASADDEDFDLVPPDGYKLVEVDGRWGLVEADEPAAPRRVTVRNKGIRCIKGGKTVYLYDSAYMKPNFTRWAFLAQEDDPLAAFAYCVREDSRLYPRPLAEASLANRPFNMDAETIASLWDQARQAAGYDDLARLEASNGDVYYYSTDHLSPQMAQSLAEWESVERYMNV